jgi:hypothetical protein
MIGQVRCPAGHWHFPNLGWKHAGCVANTSPMVANAEEARVANTTRHGKYADPDKRREYMRDLMRKRRSQEKRNG